jgi:hypothetical protein
VTLVVLFGLLLWFLVFVLRRLLQEERKGKRGEKGNLFQ